MPPATTRSCSPVAMAWAPRITAFRPEPHTLLTVVAPTELGIPAPSEAWRAGAWPRPAGSTHPMKVSPTASAGTPARSSAARIAIDPSLGAGTLESSPMNDPMGVRAAPTIQTSRMISSLQSKVERLLTFDCRLPYPTIQRAVKPAQVEGPQELRYVRSCCAGFA